MYEIKGYETLYVSYYRILQCFQRGRDLPPLTPCFRFSFCRKKEMRLHQWNFAVIYFLAMKHHSFHTKICFIPRHGPDYAGTDRIWQKKITYVFSYFSYQRVECLINSHPRLCRSFYEWNIMLSCNVSSFRHTNRAGSKITLVADHWNNTYSKCD